MPRQECEKGLDFSPSTNLCYFLSLSGVMAWIPPNQHVGGSGTRRRKFIFFAVVAVVLILLLVHPTIRDTVTVHVDSKFIPENEPDTNNDHPSKFIPENNPNTHNDYPPSYEQLRKWEKSLPQHNLDLPYPEGKTGRYVKFTVQIQQLGWNNCLNEL
jgi:hypothetical protein